MPMVSCGKPSQNRTGHGHPLDDKIDVSVHAATAIIFMYLYAETIILF